ncbi:MAG: winged helix-turn-helix transcriptional regulator [Candidatus Aegiribacteria sp.]|nr:winged helix-turn-helix transcriptional regulator [Candidatus Aegiribacteria sp.]
MLEPLLGSGIREQVLLFIQARGSGYAREIAGFFQTSIDPVQKQLKRLEAGGILLSCFKGRTLLYRFNPRYKFIGEISSLLKKVIKFYPSDIRDNLTDVSEWDRKNTSGKRNRYTVRGYRKDE